MSAALLFAPLFPLAACGALLVGLGTRRSGPVAIGGALASAVACLAGFIGAALGGRAAVAFPWMETTGFRFELALQVDPLGAIAALLVAVVSAVVFVYADSYLADDPRRATFFAYLSLFVAAMLALVLAADLFTLFLCWELVGVCSYLLVGFWYERKGVPQAAFRAMLFTRFADLGLLLGFLLLARGAGTARIGDLIAMPLPAGTLVAAGVLIVAGAAGKSAQVPLQGWLPDAMVAPTPVSALLHSATMVAAGAFLLARLHPVLQAAGPALPIAAWIGAATALLGGAAALVERNLKRALAYSTMSQLGLMFLALGSGSIVAGISLLVAHALFKATLFLAAGNLDHALGSIQLERMGGLARIMPATMIAFLVAAAALAGLPVMIALPAKDAVLAVAAARSPLLLAAGLIASLLTALYAGRLFAVVFLGVRPDDAASAAEPRPGMLWPTLAMAALVPAGALIDASLLGRPLARFLGQLTPENGAVTAASLALAAIGVAIALGARFRWPRAVVWRGLRTVAPLLGAEMGLRPASQAAARATLAFARALDALDRASFDRFGLWTARLVRSVSRMAATVDLRVFDWIANATARAASSLARGIARFDARALDASVAAGAHEVLRAGERVRGAQTGRVENYLLYAFVWVAGLAAVAVLLRAAG